MGMRDLNPRILIGSVAFGMLLLFGLVSRYVEGLSPEDWGSLWKLAYGFAMCAALFAVFYDKENFAEKTWDFNPKRGLLYFVLGWIIFPVMIGIEIVSGADFTVGGMVLGTIGLSVLLGIIGTFTENVGI